ncbi:hypothetical protein ACFYNM_39465 [Streptomyces spororaveus]|uniref:hypothetical protein n=1 Tax=Streptomyces spororaveus TaxID=284039 RepID=UPI0036A88FB3
MTTITTTLATRAPLAARIRRRLADLAATADPQLIADLTADVNELEQEAAYLTHERDEARNKAGVLLLDMVGADTAAYSNDGLLAEVERLAERLARQGSER